MKNEKGISLLVLIITIVIIIILAAITMISSDNLIDDSINAKNDAEIALDNEKIKEIITYEIAGTDELIDIEIDLKRIPLSDTLQIEYDGKIYSGDYTLYLSEKDIKKVEEETGTTNYYKSYKDLTKSYVVDHEKEEFTRLEEEWEFKK